MDNTRQVQEHLNEGCQDTNEEAFVLYLDGVSAWGWAQAYKRRTFTLLDVQEGQRVLDVGCGTGDDVRMLAQLVGKAGRAVGVDNSEVMIREARQRSTDTLLPVEYHLGDVHHLEFADNTFDGCRADRTFQHLDLPQRALSEMMRVTRTGGHLVVSDPDWETLVVDASDQAVTRKVLNFWCDSIHNGWMGRRLPGLFKQCGLTEITVEAGTLTLTNYGVANQLFQFRGTAEAAQKAGIVSEIEAASWLENLQQTHLSGHFFCAVTAFSVSGRKP